MKIGHVALMGVFFVILGLLEEPLLLLNLDLVRTRTLASTAAKTIKTIQTSTVNLRTFIVLGHADQRTVLNLMSTASKGLASNDSSPRTLNFIFPCTCLSNI